MTNDQISLSEETLAQISRLQPATQIRSVIRYADIIVGVCIHDELPSQVALPAGLDFQSIDNFTLADISACTSVADLPDTVTLRFCTQVSLSLNKLDDFCETICKSSAATIDGVVFSDDLPVSNYVKGLESPSMHRLQLFTRFDTPATAEQPQPQVLSFSMQDDCKDHMIRVDALAYVSSSATLKEVLQAISTSARRNASKTLSARYEDNLLTSGYFQVLGGGLPVCYFAKTHMAPDVRLSEDDAEQVESRREVHAAFCLPEDRRLFRRACRLAAAGDDVTFDGGCTGRLSNVHVGIKSHGFGEDGVSVHLTSGRYLYCHYLQNRFKDSGWGCAYRSLQTILSWCVFERYVRFDNGVLPTHEHIQRALVHVGDKKASFIGSQEWIGANEVCYALEELTGLSSKIVHVSRGSEILGCSRELARHFDEQGSPVMIGGGVLAWTILGIARNERTGKCKFLILDPHYEGRDDLKSIQSKHWIGWKGEDIFKETAFYNLCLPQRPQGV